MVSNDIPDREMERKLEVYFEAESARLRAPAGLWERIEGMLKEHSDLEGKTTAWRRVFSPRRWGLVPAFVTTIVLLLAVSGTWLSTAAPWQDGVDAEPLTTELDWVAQPCSTRTPNHTHSVIPHKCGRFRSRRPFLDYNSWTEGRIWTEGRTWRRRICSRSPGYGPETGHLPGLGIHGSRRGSGGRGSGADNR